MSKLQAFWNTLKSNPVFVAAWTAFAGAFGKEVMTAYTTGKLDWSLQSWQQMGAAAALMAIVSLVHLYIIPANPTVPATIPPSTTVVDVPAKIEPVDPKTIPTEEKQ